MIMGNIKELDKQYIAGTYSRFPIVITHGKGSLLYDEDGKEYIDLGSGIAVNSFGACDDEWMAAVTEQLQKIQHTSNLYYTEPCVKVAEMLSKMSGMKKAFFCNSGAEANEGAIKAARRYAEKKKGANYYNIVTLENSFHGRTLTTLAATGQPVFHEHFGPLTPGFVNMPVNDIETLLVTVSEKKTAAIMIECVQGEGGVNPLDRDFVNEIAKICKEKDILLIVDEVQTGLCRSGEYFAYQSYGITPDIVTVAKGLGGGLPIGAVLLGEKVQDVLEPGEHGSTFGGNLISCAGAISVLSRMDETLLAEVKKKSEYIKNRLEGAEGVEFVGGLGLMLGIKTKKPAKDVVAKAMENGVLCLTAKDKVRLLPALNIPQELLEKAMDVLIDACKE